MGIDIVVKLQVIFFALNGLLLYTAISEYRYQGYKKGNDIWDALFLAIQVGFALSSIVVIVIFTYQDLANINPLTLARLGIELALALGPWGIVLVLSIVGVIIDIILNALESKEKREKKTAKRAKRLKSKEETQ